MKKLKLKQEEVQKKRNNKLLIKYLITLELKMKNLWSRGMSLLNAAKNRRKRKKNFA